MKRTWKMFTAVVLALTLFAGVLAGCKGKAPEITLDGVQESTEVPFGEVYTPPSYIILADGEDTGLNAKVRSDGVTDPDGEPVQISYGRFTPVKQGEYTLVYESSGLTEMFPDFFQEEKTWTLKINAADKTGPATTAKAEDVNYKVVWVGKTVPVPDFTASDPSEVDESKTAIYVQQPDGTEVKVENGIYTTQSAGQHKWLYKVWDKVGNSSVQEYAFNVIEGPVTVIDDCIGYFDQEFGLSQITAYNASAAVDADFVWEGIDGAPKGAIVMEQSVDQWEINGASEWGGLGIDGSMQIELFGPYIEELSKKYDVIYLPMYNPNDYPIEVRVWFDKCVNIPAHGTINYVFPASNYDRGSNILMYSGDYQVIHDVYRTTFSCGMANGSLFSFTDLFAGKYTNDELVAYYAEREGVSAEEAASAVNALDWTGRENLLIDFLKNSEKWGTQKTQEVLHTIMLPKGTKWYIGPMYGVNQEEKDTDNVKYLADLGYVGGVANVASYGDRMVLYSNSAEFVDAEKGIEGAVIYQAGTYTNTLGSGVAIRLQNLKYDREDLAAKMGKDDYISFWLKKPASCTADFKVLIGYTAYEVEPNGEWQEIRLYKHDIGSQHGGKDGLDYLYGDSGYEDPSTGTWITTYPNDIILRLLGNSQALVYDGIELAISGVTLHLSGSGTEERFSMTVAPDAYDAVVEGDTIEVPSFTTSYEASDSGKTVARKEVYLEFGGERKLMTETSYSVTQSGEYKWIFLALDENGTTVSENQVGFTVMKQATTLDVPYTADKWASKYGTFEAGDGHILFNGNVGHWDATYVATTGLLNEAYDFDKVIVTVKNLSSEKMGVFFANDYNTVWAEVGQTVQLEIAASKLKEGSYIGSDGKPVTGINGLALHIVHYNPEASGSIDDDMTNIQKIQMEISYTMYKVGGEIEVAPSSVKELPYGTDNWEARVGGVAAGTDCIIYNGELGWDTHLLSVKGLDEQEYTFDYAVFSVKNTSGKDIRVRVKRADVWDFIIIKDGETKDFTVAYSDLSDAYQNNADSSLTGINGVTLHFVNVDDSSDNFGGGSGYSKLQVEVTCTLYSFA